MHNTICVNLVCIQLSMEIIYMFFVSQVSWLVENFHIRICSDTVNVINVKLCMMVLLIEL